ncbi:MAG: isopentenyl-diphosphate Delta-isomerase [Brumimicrobium sp.]|nr:isopentenyl-diphosphate Delta-isomerase [Brumimicrobium sp.]
MGTREVVLVNERDEVLGTMEKMEAHRKGLLHRAFSVVIFNDKNEMLVHRRADDKYHCGGLWTNACCSHPRLNENVKAGAQRRLMEEMGFSCDLTFIDTFIYKAAFENGLIEHELDHLFVGHYNDHPSPNEQEVSDWKYISLDALKKEMTYAPQNFTFWFKEIMHNKFEQIQQSIL